MINSIPPCVLILLPMYRSGQVTPQLKRTTSASAGPDEGSRHLFKPRSHACAASGHDMTPRSPGLRTPNAYPHPDSTFDNPSMCHDSRQSLGVVSDPSFSVEISTSVSLPVPPAYFDESRSGPVPSEASELLADVREEYHAPDSHAASGTAMAVPTTAPAAPAIAHQVCFFI